MTIKLLKQFTVFTIVLFVFMNQLACKSKKDTASKTNETEQATNTVKGEGKVTHQFKSTGCGPVIICKKENDTLYLIPVNPLDKFDVDGLEIVFNYRIVRVHNPKGCHKGIPAQVSNIKAKK